MNAVEPRVPIGSLARLANLLIGLSALLVPAIIVLISVTVLFAQFGVNPVFVFQERVTLLGRQLNLTGLTELQWHAYALLIALACAPVLLENNHVRVDFIYERLPERWQHAINLMGHLLFALPFLWLCLSPSLALVQRALRTGEGSVDGGLSDRWLAKSTLPLLLGLLLAAVLIDLVRLIHSLRRPRA